MDLVKSANERRPVVPRLDGVDVLRGLSILAVIVLHVYIRLRGYGFKPATDWPRWLFHLIFLNGNNGVTIFFAVSGFLITLTSLRRFGSLAEMRAQVFYRIRFARIAPLLLLVLGVLSALCLAHVPGYVISPKVSTLPRALLAALTFHLNYLEAVRGWLPANWDVLWSLSVEEMFYLFFPLVCLVLLRFGRGVYLFVALLVAFVVMGPFARTVWAWNDIWQEKSYLGGMDAIALGCLTALLVARLQRAGRRVGAGALWGLQVLGAAMIVLIFVWPTWHHVLKYVGRSGLDGTILALGACLVIFATTMRGSRGRIWTAPLRWFGRHSYEVYMTHEFVVVAGVAAYAHVQRGPLAVWYVGLIVLTAPLGWAVARFFSEPMNRRLRGAASAR